MENSNITVRRLTVSDATLIVDCFKRVYGDSYANETFYDVDALAAKMQDETLFSVGALANGKLIGHMAMTIVCADASSAELGNTVVDPDARGSGIAWRVGDELTRWCKARGYGGFLHYPTTNHHIMQQQSVKAGFETGLMLGYIPAETDGQTEQAGAVQDGRLRQAATVVYQPLTASSPMRVFCPEQFRDLIVQLATPTALPRQWLPPPAHAAPLPNRLSSSYSVRRGVQRITVAQSGFKFDSELGTCLSEMASAPCRQLDLLMDNPNIADATSTALAAGFKFCAWLPGYRETDVLRLQRIAVLKTQMQPVLVNPVAQSLLELMR